MVKVGEAKRNENRGKLIYFDEISRKCNMHHWLRGLMPLNNIKINCRYT